MVSLKNQDIVSALQFDRDTVLYLFELAEKLRSEIRDKGILDYARGKIMATVFLEPSTRTKLSFQFAMKRLGGDVIDFDVTTSSLAKGETDVDTLRIIDGYDPDVIVLRQSKPGFPEQIKDIINAPIINAGDGWNEHPTQALLDVYTIWRELGHVDGLTIGIMGDLKYGRTPSSLSYLLSKFNNITIYYIAPKPLQIREEVLKKIEGKIDYYLVDNVEEVIEKLDVLYVTRLQKERLPDKSMYEELKGSYRITANMLMKYRKIPIIMHPLPRTWELDSSVDKLPQAKYFEQARNGLYVRAALIKEVLGV
ncbi:aspartate carbamoyltransferase [Desulfurococcaceae archaeon MEX13E-LK6-19]|nr:aspartate carbamoyltransferase [Desulfurococcaceae archaeon MEX13E-LK6-19]